MALTTSAESLTADAPVPEVAGTEKLLLTAGSPGAAAAAARGLRCRRRAGPGWCFFGALALMSAGTLGWAWLEVRPPAGGRAATQPLAAGQHQPRGRGLGYGPGAHGLLRGAVLVQLRRRPGQFRARSTTWCTPSTRFSQWLRDQARRPVVSLRHVLHAGHSADGRPGALEVPPLAATTSSAPAR